MRKLGAVLLVGGVAALVAYVLYVVFTSILSAFIPLPFRIIVTIIIVGVLLLLASVIRERLQAAKKESFRDVER